MHRPKIRLSSKSKSPIPLLRQVTIKVQAVGGINLGQGTCQLPVPPEVLGAAAEALAQGANRYTLAQGTAEARLAIADKLARHNGIVADPEHEVLITPGVTGAFEAVCATVLEPQDEVVCFEPFYPYHHNALTRAGARINYLPLTGSDWSFSPEALDSALARGPKFILINTPSNPCGKVFSRAELRIIGQLAMRHDILVVTDEMYEYMTFDGVKHISPASLPEFAGRTVTMGGYSKTFAVTGWRIGYAVAPVEIAHSMARTLDELYVCTPSVAQAAITRALATLKDEFYAEIGRIYERKRDFFCDALRRAGFDVIVPQGAYYIIADFGRRYGKLSAGEFVNAMIELVRVGAVPAGDFVRRAEDEHWVRFCFAVEDVILEAAAERLESLAGLWRTQLPVSAA